MVWAPSGLNVLIHEPLLWALKEYVDEIGIQRLFAEDGGDASEMSSSKDSRMKKSGGKKVTFQSQEAKDCIYKSRPSYIRRNVIIGWNTSLRNAHVCTSHLVLRRRQ